MAHCPARLIEAIKQHDLASINWNYPPPLFPLIRA
jgi:hypothetical protein